VQVRRRVGSLESLPAAAGEQAAAFTDHGALVVADGVGVDDSVLSSVVAHAQRHGLDAVDLVPADLPMERGFSLFRTTDPATYRTAAKAPLGGCQAVWTS